MNERAFLVELLRHALVMVARLTDQNERLAAALREFTLDDRD